MSQIKYKYNPKVVTMEKLFYQFPELRYIDIAVECGFASSSKSEDPELDPELDW